MEVLAVAIKDKSVHLFTLDRFIDQFIWKEIIQYSIYLNGGCSDDIARRFPKDQFYEFKIKDNNIYRVSYIGRNNTGRFSYFYFKDEDLEGSILSTQDIIDRIQTMRHEDVKNRAWKKR